MFVLSCCRCQACAAHLTALTCVLAPTPAGRAFAGSAHEWLDPAGGAARLRLKPFDCQSLRHRLIRADLWGLRPLLVHSGLKTAEHLKARQHVKHVLKFVIDATYKQKVVYTCGPSASCNLAPAWLLQLHRCCRCLDQGRQHELDEALGIVCVHLRQQGQQQSNAPDECSCRPGDGARV